MGQLSALFFKNWLLYKRGCVGNIFEFIVPIFFLAFVVMIRRLDPIVTYDQQAFISNATYSKQIISTTAMSAFLKQKCATQLIALAPSGDPLKDKLYSMIGGLGYSVYNFSTEADLESYVRSTTYQASSQICFGITVQNSTAGNYQYKLRFNISQNPERSDGPSAEALLTQDKGIDLEMYNYMIQRGMIGGNNLVNTAIFQLQTGNNNNYLQNNVAPVYQQKYILDNLYTNAGTSIGIIVLLPLLILYLRQTSSMLTQKQSKVRQSMYIMGMKGINYYFSWFCRYFFVYLALHLLGALIVKSQLTYVPFYIVFLLFIIFDIVIIIQNFFIQVFLSRAKIGVVISLLYFILQYVISFVATGSNNPTLSVNAAASIIPHTALILAFQTIFYAESYQIVPTFGGTLNNYVIGYALVSFFLNIIFYLILTWYLDQVIPNEWGAKRHPLFCFFSKGSTLTADQKNDYKKELIAQPTYKEIYQEIQQGLLNQQVHNTAIEIVALRKQFGGSKDEKIVAVNDLTVSMYQGQIFALLGHNGAGKTTTISMLTGMTDPDKGYLSVYGNTQIQKIREMLGVCPQHDTLYEDLTVQEHLQLFGAFKGLEGQQLNIQVRKLIADVNLLEKKDEYSKNLSGGQKRRLSVAIAFAGRSKVIVLDEPTSGMDTSARRYIWDLLKAYKNDRIIILTTHFMDQADYLGDRIGIMGEGRLLCCGSSPFLKNKFGVGYSITFSKQSPETDSNPIISTIKKYVPGAEVLSDVATDLSIQLPLINVSSFPQMFNQLDSKKTTLKFVQYGISITTLEEVFLNVANSLKDKKEDVSIKQLKLGKNLGQPQPSSQDDMMSPNKSMLKDSNNGMVAENQNQQSFDFDRIPREDGMCYRFLIHFKATFQKRLRVIFRDLKSFIFELILPFLIILLALFLLRINFIKDESPKSLALSTYAAQQNPLVIPIGADTTSASSSMKAALQTKYGSQIFVSSDTASTIPSDFDKNFLYPIKLANQTTFRGGIFFYQNSATNGSNTIYQFNTLVMTRSPTSPLFLGSLATETILQKLGYNVTIQLTNHPLPRTYQQLQINNTISGFFAGFIFSIALAFKFASIIAFIVKERQDRSKHQQIVSGMSISAYWIANFLYDFILYMVVSFITILISKAMKISSLTDGNAYAATWMLFIFYGLSYINLTYILAFYYKDYGNAQAAYYFITFVAGGLLPLLTFLLRILGQGSNKIGRGIAWALRLFPPFAFGEGLMNEGSVSLYSLYENNYITMDALDLQIAKSSIIYMAVESVVFFVLLLVIEKLLNTESFMRSFLATETAITQTKPIAQEDVVAQRQKALAAKPADYEILAKQLRKVYMVDGPRKYKVAVDNLSFGIKKGEVFGLLGINGAGKTTTFKMLAGQVTSTAGQSFFNGERISENLDTVREGLGYCPQFDALVQNLTVQEQLQLYYDLKSLSRVFKKEAIKRKIKELDLTQYVDRLSGTLSGGNKRKLSVAMAMIGNPRIVFLDQPSTGMDPKARRFMWKVIARVATQKKDATVVLTTHSMQEAQALSSRLGIMVKGNFQCIGTPQHIKSKYGDGLQLEIKLKNPQKAELMQIMQAKKVIATSIKAQKISQFFDYFNVQGQDRLQISQKGSGNYIFYALKERSEIQVYTLVQFVQLCKMHRQLMKQLSAQLGTVQELQKYQTFVRLKIKGKPNIGKLFEFLEKQKGRLSIQQYTIKQATVQQIFNKFAENGEQTQYNG